MSAPDAPAPATAADAVVEARPVDTSQGATPRRGARLRPWLELMLMVSLALAGAWAVQRWAVKPFHVPSGSMEPTLRVGDRVLVSRFGYRLSAPERFDVVVFHPPREEFADDEARPDLGVNYVKRVVGLPGEWIGGRDGRVWICPRSPTPRVSPTRSGCSALAEPYLEGEGARFRFRRVPPGHYFMLGDNREQSSDSREIGPIPRSSLVGRAFAIYWPPHRVAGLG